MYELTLINRNGGAYIDSREVAEAIGKRHDHLLRDIRNYAEIMGKIGFPKVGESDFFVQSSFVNAQNKAMPCYLISKMGCELVANKLIGEKGVLFTVAYVTKFNEMEQKERADLEARGATPQLRTFNTAVRNVLSGYANTYASAEEVMAFLRGAYKPFGIDVIQESGTHYLTAGGIARIIGIYSMSGKPHGHAVAAIIEKLNIAPKHITVIPYGLVGISMRYDQYVLDAVRGWIADNHRPYSVPHLNFEYHIRYDYQLSLFDDYNDDDFDYFGDDI